MSLSQLNRVLIRQTKPAGKCLVFHHAALFLHLITMMMLQQRHLARYVGLCCGSLQRSNAPQRWLVNNHSHIPCSHFAQGGDLYLV